MCICCVLYGIIDFTSKFLFKKILFESFFSFHIPNMVCPLSRPPHILFSTQPTMHFSERVSSPMGSQGRLAYHVKAGPIPFPLHQD